MSLFELLSKETGFARIGRVIVSKEQKKYLSTPNIVIPINKALERNLNFNEQFEKHEFFSVSEPKNLYSDLFLAKFKNAMIIFSYSGTLDEFKERINEKAYNLAQENLLTIIPFAVPFTSISKEFASEEISNYLKSVEDIVNKHPTVRFGLSLRVFDYPSLIENYLEFVKNHANIVVLNFLDLFENLSNFRNIVKFFLRIKQELNNNLIIMVSGKVSPKIYPILIYLGVDLIEGEYSLYLSSESFYDTIEYLLPAYKIKDIPCSCVACSEESKKYFSEKYSLEKILRLSLHNLITAKIQMNKIKQYLNYEDFRAFVEKSVQNDNYLISMLKVLDKQYFDSFKFETPITQDKKTISCLGPSSYFRPDFQEFRKRVIESFDPEPWTRIIVLFPCSAKKPYSESKSHKMFNNVLRKFSEFPTFQEIILTSPLGAIPRQLENVYPVNSYDISVTGEWDSEELKISTDMLIELLKKFEDEVPVVCHLEGGYREIVNKAKESTKKSISCSDGGDNLISREALQSLENVLREILEKQPSSNQPSVAGSLTKSWSRKFLKILDYQFKKGAGLKIAPEGFNVKENKKTSQFLLFDPSSKENLGTFKSATGQIYLTIRGAQRLLPLNDLSNYIVFNGDKISGNTLFRAGILEYSSELIPENHVIVIDESKKNVIGVGQLVVGSNFIKNANSGRVAKIYERRG